MFDERLEKKTLFEATLPSVPEKSNITHQHLHAA